MYYIDRYIYSDFRIHTHTARHFVHACERTNMPIEWWKWRRERGSGGRNVRLFEDAKDIAPFCIFSQRSQNVNCTRASARAHKRTSERSARARSPKNAGQQSITLRAAKLFRKVAENLLARSGCNNKKWQQQQQQLRNNTLKIMIVYGFT